MMMPRPASVPPGRHGGRVNLKFQVQLELPVSGSDQWFKLPRPHWRGTVSVTAVTVTAALPGYSGLNIISKVAGGVHVLHVIFLDYIFCMFSRCIFYCIFCIFLLKYVIFS
jgi:hypothetical protein